VRNAAGAVTFVAESSHATGYTLDKLGRTVEERTFVKNPLGASRAAVVSLRVR